MKLNVRGLFDDYNIVDNEQVRLLSILIHSRTYKLLYLLNVEYYINFSVCVFVLWQENEMKLYNTQMKFKQSRRCIVIIIISKW